MTVSEIKKNEKERCHSVKINFPNNDAKERVKAFAGEKLGFQSMKHYMLHILEYSGDVKPMKQRIADEDVADYTLALNPKQYKKLQEKAKKQKMKNSAYMLAVIDIHMRLHGTSMDDRNNRYLLFYRENREERKLSSDSLQFIESEIKRLRKIGYVSDILLVDLDERTRTKY